MFQVIVPVCILSQVPMDSRRETLKLQAVIKKYHFSPPTYDSSFSRKVFNLFLENLDPRSIFFQPKDYSDFNKFKYQIFNNIDNPSWNFTNMVESVYRQRLIQYDSALQRILNQPLDFTPGETYSETLQKTHSMPDANKDIRKYLKYRVLAYVFQTKDTVISGKDFKMLEPLARKRVLRGETAKVNRLLKKPDALHEFVSSSFLNAIAQCADPHSEYMSLGEKEQFETALQSESLSFGFYLDINENDELVIESLVPGGAAWNSKQINKGDLITAFRLPGQEKTEIADISFEEVNDILTSPENKQIEFFIRKKDGSIKSTVLTKSKLNQDEVIVKGYILKGDLKLGYISLPGFYNDFENQSNLGCANDVAKECIKLQKENISGLIIDLRDNGGGSIKEAIDLSGLFIDYGPICILKNKTDKNSVLKDLNRGTAFSGPLVILVNQQSASASEIFAAAMQDYNRAVIVGGQTYGKATGQIIVPCDTNQTEPVQPHSYVKITTDKIYRVTGKSNQKVGVLPDIPVFDIEHSDDDGESHELYPLPNDSIKKVTFKPFPPLPLDKLREKSTARTSSSTNFQRMKSLSDTLNVFVNNGFQVPLDFDGFARFYYRKSRILDSFDQILEQDSKLFKISQVQFDESLHSIKTDYEMEQMTAIQKDIYIQEAYHIISDLLESSAKHP